MTNSKNTQGNDYLSVPSDL